jgi:hypothetical protein
VRAFWVEPDRDRADRYAGHVGAHLSEFDDAWGDISPATFAAVAWRLATVPELDPGYVRWHRRIVGAWMWRNPWDGGLSATVTLVSPWPAELTSSKIWARDRGWRDWPQVFGQYVLPTPRDLAANPHLRASLSVDAPLPVDGLPVPPDGPHDEVPVLAQRAVVVLARALDDLLEPLVTQLENEVTGRSG